MFLRTLLVSFCIHFVVVALIVLNQSSFEINKTEVVEVEFKDTVPKQFRKIDKTAGAKLAKKSFLLFPKMDALDLLSKVEKNNKEPSYFNDKKTYDTDISGVFGENGNQNWSYYKEIYRRIDSNLTFDSLLAQYSHFGRVYVQFKVTEDGLFKMEDLKTDSSDPILKVHVLRAIKRSLSKTLESINYSKIDKYTLFQAEFNFRYGDYKNNFYKQENFGRPVFVFNRVTQEKPIPKELLGQLLSGGVTPNISLMYERWKKYNKQKRLDAVQFDPFENYKRDAFYVM